MVHQEEKLFEISFLLKKSLNLKEIFMTWICIRVFFQGGSRIRIRIKIKWILSTAATHDMNSR